MRKLLSFLLIIAINATQFVPIFVLTSLPVYANTGEYDCSDGIDNDYDGYTDMSDPYCIGSEAGFCYDGTDNDGDGYTDSGDGDCSSPSESGSCFDGSDNDGDGYTDGADSECSEGDNGYGCSDGMDNDYDGSTDYSDSGCYVPPVEYCSDGTDNDGDGYTDGEDSECSEGDNGYGCSDGVDNDGDGDTDLSDSGCYVPPVEYCSDGTDNDGDGYTDGCDSGCLAGEGGYCSSSVALLMTVDGSSGQFTIPTSAFLSGYNYFVDCNNDGTPEGLYVTGDYTCYGLSGTSQIAISNINGSFPGIQFNNGGDKDKLLSIDQWGLIDWQSMSNAFAGCSNLRINAVDAPNLSNVTDMSYMFYGATALNDPIDHWILPPWLITSHMFEQASSFNQPLDNWDTSGVFSIEGMFQGASSFNQPLNSWNMSNVLNMNSAFDQSGFNQNIDMWDTHNVAIMTSMFASSPFDQNISTWDISNVTDMSSMFAGSTLSTINYDALLTAWSGQTVQPNVAFDAGNSQYCAVTSHGILTNTPSNWSITDGGIGGACGTPPAIIDVTASTTNGNYNIGDTIYIQMKFDQPVNVSGTPQLLLETGTMDALANYTLGSGTDTLVFSYTVASGENSVDLDYSSISALTLNGGIIENTWSDYAVLSLPVPGTAGSLAANKNLVVDTISPTVTLTAPIPASPLTPGSFTITGTCETGLTVTLTGLGWTPTPTTAPCTGGVFSAPVTLIAGPLSVTASQTDGAGNTTMTLPVSATVTAPAPTTSTSIGGGSIVIMPSQATTEIPTPLFPLDAAPVFPRLQMLPDALEETIDNEEGTELLCKPYITSFAAYGSSNNNPEEVRLLQHFLREYAGETALPETGYFGPLTQAAVKRFQIHHSAEILEPLGLRHPTGHVYERTLDLINAIHCGS